MRISLNYFGFVVRVQFRWNRSLSCMCRPLLLRRFRWTHRFCGLVQRSRVVRKSKPHTLSQIHRMQGHTWRLIDAPLKLGNRPTSRLFKYGILKVQRSQKRQTATSWHHA